MIDGSTRSSHSNAFVAGMGASRKVVLFDTLLEQMDQGEIVAVVNHELGHIHYNHLLQGVITNSFFVTIQFLCFSFVIWNKDILVSFGFEMPSAGQSPFLYLTVFSQLFAPVGFFISFFNLSLTRRKEYQADAFAVEHGHG